jgi:hypothetical protein
MIDKKINRALNRIFYGFLVLVILTMTSCEQYEDYRESQYKEEFNKNYVFFEKLERMQREDINVFAISATRTVSFKEAKGLKEAIDNGHTYKQNNIDRQKNVDSHKFDYEFKGNEGLTNERWSEYKKLLKQAGLEHFVYTYDRPDKRQVWFFEKDKNDSGYVYMEYEPPEYFNSYSECKPIMPSQSCYILLRKNWYMFSERYRLEQE